MKNTHIDRHRTVRSAFRLNSGNLGQRVVNGASFTFLGIALRTLLTIGSMSILARLLTPADFGYLAMATVVTEFAGLLGSFGFANILVQRRIATRLQFDTVFWGSLILGSTIAAVIFVLSFTAGWLFGNETTGPLLRILCLTFVLSSLSTVHEAIVARLMRFRTDFFIQIVTIAVRSAAAILFAWSGHGVWSLVYGSVIGSACSTLLFYIAIPYLPRFRFHAAYLRSTWKTSTSYLGNTVLYYLNMNVDLLLIGRRLGPSALGYYQNSRSLTDEVRGRIAMPLQRVLFPAFSALQGDTPRLQHSVRRSGRLLAAIICPIGIGLAAVAPEIVPTLYGDQWVPMIPVLSMLGFSAALRGSTAIASSLFNSQNRVEQAFRYNLIATTLLIGSVVAAMPFGLEAVAIAIAVNSLFSVFIFRVALGLIGMNSGDLLHILARPLIAASVMWLAITTLREALTTMPLAVPVKLGTGIVTGVIVYAIVLHLLSRQYWQDFAELSGRLLKRN
jgi:PST family polysaccharide transporter